MRTSVSRAIRSAYLVFVIFGPAARARAATARQLHPNRRSASKIISALAAAKMAANKKSPCANARPSRRRQARRARARCVSMLPRGSGLSAMTAPISFGSGTRRRLLCALNAVESQMKGSRWRRAASACYVPASTARAAYFAPGFDSRDHRSLGDLSPLSTDHRDDAHAAPLWM